MSKNKYSVSVKGRKTIDVYDVLDLYNVTHPAIQHAIKKLLMPGKRGKKSKLTDLKESKQAIKRAIQMEKRKK